MYRHTPTTTRRALRLLAVVYSAPTCCGQPMSYSSGIGTNGWYCAVNPTHVRL